MVFSMNLDGENPTPTKKWKDLCEECILPPVIFLYFMLVTNHDTILYVIYAYEYLLEYPKNLT